MEAETASLAFPQSMPPVAKKRRNLPGTPDPEAEVIALSPKTLLATNRFLCEICGKGFQRDQNLQLHRRGHNLPWKLKQRSNKEIKKRVYICPEKSCVHHNPSRALGDLTGIKKHFCRKHGEKKWKCDKCSKKYAVQSDWKAHSKTCGTREYRCDCGTVFSRRDSFVTHRAFCDALAEETARINSSTNNIPNLINTNNLNYQYINGSGLIRPNEMHHLATGQFHNQVIPELSLYMGHTEPDMSALYGVGDPYLSLLYTTNKQLPNSPSSESVPSLFSNQNHGNVLLAETGMSATALLQKAARMGTSSSVLPTFLPRFETKFDNLQAEDGSFSFDLGSNYYVGGETRDFLGVGGQTLRPPSMNGWI